MNFYAPFVQRHLLVTVIHNGKCSFQTFIDNRGRLTWFIIVSPDWIPPDEP